MRTQKITENAIIYFTTMHLSYNKRLVTTWVSMIRKTVIMVSLHILKRPHITDEMFLKFSTSESFICFTDSSLESFQIHNKYWWRYWCSHRRVTLFFLLICLFDELVHKKLILTIWRLTTEWSKCFYWIKGKLSTTKY